MRARDAVKLHNGDEVIIKISNRSATVNQMRVVPDMEPMLVELKVIISNGGGGVYATVYHDEVR